MKVRSLVHVIIIRCLWIYVSGVLPWVWIVSVCSGSYFFEASRAWMGSCSTLEYIAYVFGIHVLPSPLRKHNVIITYLVTIMLTRIAQRVQLQCIAISLRFNDSDGAVTCLRRLSRFSQPNNLSHIVIYTALYITPYTAFTPTLYSVSRS